MPKGATSAALDALPSAAQSAGCPTRPGVQCLPRWSWADRSNLALMCSGRLGLVSLLLTRSVARRFTPTCASAVPRRHGGRLRPSYAGMRAQQQGPNERDPWHVGIQEPSGYRVAALVHLFGVESLKRAARLAVGARGCWRGNSQRSHWPACPAVTYRQVEDQLRWTRCRKAYKNAVNVGCSLRLALPPLCQCRGCAVGAHHFCEHPP